MPTMPSKREYTKTIHEWVIELPCDAKDFRFQLYQIEKQIMDLIGEKKANMDDAYEVIAEDDAIVFRVTKKAKKEGEP